MGFLNLYKRGKENAREFVEDLKRVVSPDDIKNRSDEMGAAMF